MLYYVSDSCCRCGCHAPQWHPPTTDSEISKAAASYSCHHGHRTSLTSSTACGSGSTTSSCWFRSERDNKQQNTPTYYPPSASLWGSIYLSVIVLLHWSKVNACVILIMLCQVSKQHTKYWHKKPGQGAFHTSKP